MRKADPNEARARELCLEAGVDPDSRIAMNEKRSMPAWCTYRDKAKAENAIIHAEAMRAVSTQDEKYNFAPLVVYGDHEAQTIEQMRACMATGNVVHGVICADGHLGYAQPVGGVIAYENQISVSGVGYDICCGNAASRLDIKYSEIKDDVSDILEAITRIISFGVGRVNNERVPDELFDLDELWHSADMKDYKDKARSQLGTVGSGNHYVDLLEDEDGYVWIGVHFGSRGLGHTTATKFVNKLGGKEGVWEKPSVVDLSKEIGQQYLNGMTLAGKYAYAGREWVVERIRKLIGGVATHHVNNHHNYAWEEEHFGKKLWVVRKGATPAFPGQQGFIGGSMGDNAVIIEGVDCEEARNSLYSTVHGAGRLFGRKEAIRRFTKEQWNDWMREKQVMVAGGDLDESPMAYRRLPDVLKHHERSIKVLHTLRPFAVAMAGRNEYDPFKD